MYTLGPTSLGPDPFLYYYAWEEERVWQHGLAAHGNWNVFNKINGFISSGCYTMIMNNVPSEHLSTANF